MENVRLNIGCGPNMFGNGWINYDRFDFTDLSNFFKTAAVDPNLDIGVYHPSVRKCINFIKNGEDVIFKQHDLRNGFSQHDTASIEAIYIGQVIEHLNPIHESPKLIEECYRIIKPGGVIRLATPDIEILLKAYRNNTMHDFYIDMPSFYNDVDSSLQLSYIMFGSCGEQCTYDNYEGHMFLYCKESMTKLLKDAGFKDIEFYYEIGKSKDHVMKNISDAGMTHSFIVEAVK